MAHDADSPAFRLTLTMVCTKQEALESHHTPLRHPRRVARPNVLDQRQVNECGCPSGDRIHALVTKILQPGKMFSF